MHPISCRETWPPSLSRGATNRLICRILRQRSRAFAVTPLKRSAPPPRATQSRSSALQIRKKVRSRPQLCGEPVPGLLILFGRREDLVAALDNGEFHFDAIEHHHPLRNSVGEFSNIGKQQSPLDRDLAGNGFDRSDAIV